MRWLRVVFVVALIFLATSPTRATWTVSLTIQEALYGGGTSGVARTDEPVTVGIPLPDSASTGATAVSDLTLTGATAGQFRILGTWPSGRIKWVLVDTLADMSAGGTDTGTALTNGGGGNFGGSNLGTDNGSTITVATGAATFTIKKANFNGFDQVVVGSTTVVSTGASDGLVITGPTPGNTTCGTCTTIYSSENDGGSTATLEENGPVKAVVKATGSFKDASANSYMKFTVRMYFYKGQKRVKATTTLRNADLGTDDSDEIAYKGIKSLEWRTVANISGTRTYDIAKEAGLVENGTLSGSDDIYLYQGQSEFMEAQNWDSVTPQYTTDSGWDLRKNGSSLDTGSNAASQAVGGWADIRNSSGVGMSIGIYQMSAYWPKSLEFKAGGSDVRIGIWPSENTRTFHQAWPQWSTHDLYFNFHDAALSSPADEFLKFQHYLLARATPTHYNTAGVFPWPVLDPTTEQTWYVSTGAAATPTLSGSSAWPYPDHSVTAGSLAIHRYRAWSQGGGENQMELRWGYILNFLQRGFTGRYLSAAHFYRFQTDDVFPHSDGFRWRDQAVDAGYGRPEGSAWTSQNDTQAFRAWIDAQHQHWYGMMDYYFLSGDELVKEAILDGPLDQYTASNLYGTTYALLAASREVGARLMGYARLYTFLNAIGESTEATTVGDWGQHIFEQQVNTGDDLCPQSAVASTGCTPWTSSTGDGVADGTDPQRGVHWAGGGYAEWCGVTLSGQQRGTGPLQQGILVQGLIELAKARGSSWTYYWTARDLAYGIARSTMEEMYYDDGSNRWDQEGFIAGYLVDFASGCTPPATEDDHLVEARTSIWSLFSAIAWQDGQLGTFEHEFTIAIQKTMGALSVNWGENGSYAVADVIDRLENPGTVTLNGLTITGFTDNGGGSYTIQWTVPAGTQSYRIKWSPKIIVDWIGFNAETYTWIGNPTTTAPWFSANNVTPPAPAGVGTTQSTTIATGTTGLSASNFSVKAYEDSQGGGGNGGRFRLRIRGAQ